MADITVDMIVEAVAKNFDKLESGLRDVGNAAEKSEKGIEKSGKQAGFLQSQFGNLVASGVLLAAGKALIDFGRASITAASDVEEMQSKFNTVFRDLAGPVTQELEQFAEAANRSKFDLMGFAATLQDTFVPLGFARDEAASMSVEIVKLAEDLASFNNLNTADVVADLQSALVGNTETLRKYGVVATQAAIDQKALEMGLQFTKGAMDGQTKAAAILALTMEGTVDAQGDAIKTADSYANQVKGMQAAVSELQIAIGTALLPVMTELVGLVTEAADRLSVAAGMAGEYNDQAGQIINANVESAKSFDELVTQANKIDEVGNMWGGLATAVTGTNAAFRDGIIGVSKELAGAAGSFEDFEGVVAGWSARSRTAFNSYLAAQGLTIEEFYKFQRAANLATEATQGSDAAMLNSVANYQRLANATGGAAEAAIAYSAAAAAARGENEELSDKQAQLANQTGTAEQAMIAANLANEQYFESLEEQAQAAEEAAAAQAELAAQLEQQEAGYFQNALAAQEAGNGQLDLNQAMYDAAAAAGASATELAVLGGALGLYSDEAVEAALRTAAINIKIQELAQAYANGEISVSGMHEELNDFIANLDESATSAGNAGSEVQNLADTMANLPDSHTFTVKINQEGGLPTLPQGGAGAGTGGGAPAQAFASGTDGWQMVPGGTGQPYPVTLHGGEMFNVVPANQVNSSGGGSGAQFSGPLIGAVYQQPGESTEMFAARTADKLAVALRTRGAV